MPVSAADVAERGHQEGWSDGFTDKVAGWAGKVESGEHMVIKNPEFFSSYMREELRSLV